MCLVFFLEGLESLGGSGTGAEGQIHQRGRFRDFIRPSPFARGTNSPISGHENDATIKIIIGLYKQHVKYKRTVGQRFG